MLVFFCQLGFFNNNKNFEKQFSLTEKTAWINWKDCLNIYQS